MIMAEQKSDTRRLFKSRKDKIVDGVCGGVAEYFQIDATIVRIIWAASFLINGVGLWAYVIGAIVIPPNPEHKDLKADEKKKHHPQFIVGTLLIVIGILFLFNSWSFPLFWEWPFPVWHWEWWSIPWRILGPLALIGLGLVYIFSVLKQDTAKAIETGNSVNRLQRPVQNRMVAGVCAAFAQYFHTDPTWIRIGYALLAVLTHFFPLAILYIILSIVIPKEKEQIP
jgi:phage shock protein C